MRVLRQLQPGSSKGLSRRRWPRFDARGDLRAEIVSLELVMTVRDVSYGGLAVEAPVRFVRGEVHDLQLLMAGRPPQPVRARTAYCHPKHDREHLFTTGWEALGDPETARVMAAIVGRLLAQYPD